MGSNPTQVKKAPSRVKLKPAFMDTVVKATYMVEDIIFYCARIFPRKKLKNFLASNMTKLKIPAVTENLIHWMTHKDETSKIIAATSSNLLSHNLKVEDVMFHFPVIFAGKKIKKSIL